MESKKKKEPLKVRKSEERETKTRRKGKGKDMRTWQRSEAMEWRYKENARRREEGVKKKG